MVPDEPEPLEAFKQDPAPVKGFVSARNSDGSALALYIHDGAGKFHKVVDATEATVCMIQNALADPNQSVKFYLIEDRVGLMFRRIDD